MTLGRAVRVWSCTKFVLSGLSGWKKSNEIVLDCADTNRLLKKNRMKMTRCGREMRSCIVPSFGFRRNVVHAAAGPPFLIEPCISILVASLAQLRPSEGQVAPGKVTFIPSRLIPNRVLEYSSGQAPDRTLQGCKHLPIPASTI